MDRRTFLGLAAALAATGPVVACQAPNAAGNDRIMVPNQPGGGYDATARAAAKIMASAGIGASPLDVFNLPGGSGAAAMSRLAGERGNDHVVLMMGLGLVGAFAHPDRRDQLLAATAVTRLVTEPGILMVPQESAIRGLDDFLRAWRRDPRSIRIGGGSAVGGPDHLLPLLLARQVGVDPTLVRFVPHDGGGGLMPSLLGGRVDVGVSGAGEYLPHIASGGVRVLAVSGDGAVTLPGVHAPSLSEAGHPVDFVNWRGLLAPPGMGEHGLKAWLALWERLDKEPQWEQTCASFGWSRAGLSAGAFADFLAGQARQVSDLLAELRITDRA